MPRGKPGSSYYANPKQGTLPLTILVQGGIASGKSTISRLLAEQGALRVDCDRLAQAELLEPAVLEQLREALKEPPNLENR